MVSSSLENWQCRGIINHGNRSLSPFPFLSRRAHRTTATHEEEEDGEERRGSSRERDLDPESPSHSDHDVHSLPPPSLSLLLCALCPKGRSVAAKPVRQTINCLLSVIPRDCTPYGYFTKAIHGPDRVAGCFISLPSVVPSLASLESYLMSSVPVGPYGHPSVRKRGEEEERVKKKRESVLSFLSLPKSNIFRSFQFPLFL